MEKARPNAFLGVLVVSEIGWPSAVTAGRKSIKTRTPAKHMPDKMLYNRILTSEGM